MASLSHFLKYILKYIALGGYVVVYLLSSFRLLHLPAFSIAAGITFLSLFETPFSNYVFNWSLYSLLVYMLITYHEMDGCILETCDQSESAAFVSIVSTIIAWTSISDRKKKTKSQPESPKTLKAVEVKQVSPPVPIVPVIKLKPLAKPAEPKVRPFPKLHWV